MTKYFFHGLLSSGLMMFYGLFNECWNSLSNVLFYGQSGSLNHCTNFDLDVSTANAGPIRWRCLFPTPTTFAVQATPGLPCAWADRIRWMRCALDPHCSKDLVLANIFVGHVKLRSSNLESINNNRCFQILKNIAQSWHITKRYKQHQKVSINCVDMSLNIQLRNVSTIKHQTFCIQNSHHSPSWGLTPFPKKKAVASWENPRTPKRGSSLSWPWLPWPPGEPPGNFRVPKTRWKKWWKHWDFWEEQKLDE